MKWTGVWPHLGKGGEMVRFATLSCSLVNTRSRMFPEGTKVEERTCCCNPKVVNKSRYRASIYVVRASGMGRSQ